MIGLNQIEHTCGSIDAVTYGENKIEYLFNE